MIYLIQNQKPTIYILYLLFASFVAEAYLTFFGGQTFVLRLGKYWQLPELMVFIAAYLWLFIVVLNRSRNSQKSAPLPRMIRYSFYVLIFILIWSIFLGYQNRNIAFVVDSKAFFLVMILIIIGYTASLSSTQILKVISPLTRPVLLLALIEALDIFSTLFFKKHILPTTYVDHNVSFVIAFCTIIYFVRVFIHRSPDFEDRCALFLLVNTLMLIFWKPLLFIVLGSVVIIIMMSSNKYRKKIFRIIVMLMFFIVLISITNPLNYMPLSVREFYIFNWEQYFLHVDGEISGGRFILWSEAIKMILDRPLGYGTGIWLSDQLSNEIIRPVDVHNFYLYSFLAFGIPGGLIILLLLQQIIYLLLQWYRTSCKIDEASIILSGFLFIFLLFILIGVFSMSQVAYISFGITTGLLLRLIINNRNIGSKKPASSPS